eukprot:scaffold10946_cov114-Isochrysis_galbana.AAC.7
MLSAVSPKICAPLAKDSRKNFEARASATAESGASGAWGCTMASKAGSYSHKSHTPSLARISVRLRKSSPTSCTGGAELTRAESAAGCHA